MYRIVKRALDILFSFVGLIVLLPLLILLMLIISLESSGSPIFQQQRVGRYGRSFSIYKMRTMHKAAPHDTPTSALTDSDVYITKVGAFLRKTSLDELPQLWNVLRGDMSVIGPRPLVPGEGKIHEERMACGAYDVRPGITGWAQVNGRDRVNAGRKAEMDGHYANNLTFGLDLNIFIRSVICVLTARGIQEGAEEAPAQVDEQPREPEASPADRSAS